VERVSALGLDWVEIGEWSLVAPHFPTDNFTLESKAPRSPSIIVVSLLHGALDERTFCHFCNRFLLLAHFRGSSNLCHAPCPQDTSYLRVRTGIGHFKENTNICKFPVEMSELQIPPKQTRKRRSTGAMRESEEVRKKNALGLQQHSTRSITDHHTDDGMREPQNDSASTTSLAVCLSAPSSTQTSIEIDDLDIWDLEAGRGWVRQKFSETKTERRHKMEALEKQTLSDAMDRGWIWCCRCRSFAATDTENLCVDCFHTRCSGCKHPRNLIAENHRLADAEENAPE